MSSKGLEGVIAAETSICFIDGQRGVLSYRGYDIHELAPNATFEEVVFLLWEGRLPTQPELEGLRAELARHRELPPTALTVLREVADKMGPMDALRTAVSALAAGRTDADEHTVESARRKSIEVTAQVATIVAYYHRLRRGLPLVPPDAALSHAANFLYMLTGRVPTEAAERAFDVALILHADHDLNASTFAARVTAATLSDYHSAITSAVGTLKGPLHGGANIGVMRMLLDIERSGKDPAAYVREKLAAKERISGFGHRVYKTLDPRAVHLAALSKELGRQAGDLKWYEMSTAVQRVMKEKKGLDANVDFFSASSYYVMGIPLDLYTPIFAVSRVAGWSAHVIEQHADNRLIRPLSDYQGELGRKWVPIGQRKATPPGGASPPGAPSAPARRPAKASAKAAGKQPRKAAKERARPGAGRASKAAGKAPAKAASKAPARSKAAKAAKGAKAARPTTKAAASKAAPTAKNGRASGRASAGKAAAKPARKPAANPGGKPARKAAKTRVKA